MENRTELYREGTANGVDTCSSKPAVVQDVPRIPESMSFSTEEERMLAMWQAGDHFKKSLELRKDGPRYSFFDGPPFATGLPHYGHVLAGTIKDTITRHISMLGYYCERRFGWDTHGLPVEHEIDVALNIKGPQDVEKMGIENYNSECRKIVTKYAKEWKTIMTRMGRWIDFENDYKTLYPWYMESIWSIFKELYNRGLVYEGVKVMPYSTGCSTPLSNFEAGQDYRDVTDPFVTVALTIIDDQKFKGLLGSELLVWTTTPWTLPSNLAACVNSKMKYAHFSVKSRDGRRFIMLESLIQSVFKDDKIDMLSTFDGSKLEGVRYKPIFPYFEKMKDTAFRVLCDDYVTADSGTGVVHQAPYFGEDDYRVCLENKVITKETEPVCPIDEIGQFKLPVVDYVGQYVKDADKSIIELLKKRGSLISQGQVKHSYPYCWRSRTPLIYRAVPSWFVKVEEAQERLKAACADTNWVPSHVRDKRFSNWLANARDWVVSRNRYWGCPIPIWRNDQEFVVVGSIEQLSRLTGVKVEDLHRETVDKLEIPSSVPGRPPLKRIAQVFDCWFESGAMPYAQAHFPFEGDNAKFFSGFPADFIAEGIDQTRGWFYTLLVLGTLLFEKAPFKNCIANGLVLAEDGQKMSKSKRNFPDPMEIVGKYGADALRLYLITSPIVRGENLRFKEDGVREVLKDVILPWYNASRFMFQCIEGYVKEQNAKFTYDKNKIKRATNIMDQWIVSYVETLIEHVCKEMREYKLYNVVPKLVNFISQLTNCYVRMNRLRMRGENGKEDCEFALITLFHVNFRLVQVMAPFAPFFTENMYQYIKRLAHLEQESVHFLLLEPCDQAFVRRDVERAVDRMQGVVELVRMIREKKGLPNKLPLPQLIIVHQEKDYIADINMLQKYILSETNVREIKTTTDRHQFKIGLRAEPDYKVLGEKLKGDLKSVTASIRQMKDAEITDMLHAGQKTIGGHVIAASEIRPIFTTQDMTLDKYEINTDNDVLVLLHAVPDLAMVDEGTAREIINRIQKLRKKAQLVPTDRIAVYYKATGDLERVAISHSAFIQDAIKADFKPHALLQKGDHAIIDQSQQLKDCDLTITLTREGGANCPTVDWVNLYHVCNERRYGNGFSKGIALLKKGNRVVTVPELLNSAYRLFGIRDCKFVDKKFTPVTDKNLRDYASQTIFVVPSASKPFALPDIADGVPSCKVHNFNLENVQGTIILENPSGLPIVDESDYDGVIDEWFFNVKGVHREKSVGK